MKRLFLFSLVVFFLFGCEAKLPEFSGVYVLESGKYNEVPRINVKPIPFNHQKRVGVTDCNVKVVFRKDQFIPVEQDTINKRGFLVVQNKEWSEIKLFRVPNSGYLKDNEKGNEIITEVGFGCGLWGTPSVERGLKEKMSPKEIEIKQAKKGENAYLYVPTSSIEKGYYLIDYSINGEHRTGWNPIYVK